MNMKPSTHPEVADFRERVDRAMQRRRIKQIEAIGRPKPKSISGNQSANLSGKYPRCPRCRGPKK